MADPARLAVWRAFLQAHSAVTQVLERELVVERQLPLTWYEVLDELSERKDHQLSMQELARSVLLSKSGVTRLVDRMERARLVERQVSATDHRVVYARLTPAGRATLRRASPVHLRGVEDHFMAQLSEREVAALRSAFCKILESADDEHPSGRHK
jgi:DNA-binding MarR family transcriptional regulator